MTRLPRLKERVSTFGRTLFLGLLTAGSLAFSAPVASAQSQFDAAIRVNDLVVTQYEIDQRARFLTVIGSSVNPIAAARDALIDDRLRTYAARLLGISATEQGVEDAMNEFAGRANMTAAQFIEALGREGVAAQTFRDFIEAGLVWRAVVQTRFRGSVEISEDEIDRALSSGDGRGGIRVLLSEIVMPLTPQTEQQVLEIAQSLQSVRSDSEFADAALKYSVAPTRVNGGRVDWVTLDKLPPQLVPEIMKLGVGGVSEPLNLQNAVAIYRLRAIGEGAVRKARIAALDYMTYAMPGGRSESTLAKAAKIRASVDRCDDLYGVAQGQPEEVLQRYTQTPAQVPSDISAELVRLDPGEISTNLTRNGGETLLFVMLCARTPVIDGSAKREDIAAALRNQRLESFAEGYLSQLRAEATIVEQ